MKDRPQGKSGPSTALGDRDPREDDDAWPLANIESRRRRRLSMSDGLTNAPPPRHLRVLGRAAPRLPTGSPVTRSGRVAKVRLQGSPSALLLITTLRAATIRVNSAKMAAGGEACGCGDRCRPNGAEVHPRDVFRRAAVERRAA